MRVSDRRPDEEGIKTAGAAGGFLLGILSDRRPDEEGIKTAVLGGAIRLQNFRPQT